MVVFVCRRNGTGRAAICLQAVRLWKKSFRDDRTKVAPATDEVLREQYRQHVNLEARISLHERFSVNPYQWLNWAFGQFKLEDEARILELGCETGKLRIENLERIPKGWQITLSDFSGRMIKEALNGINARSSPFEFLRADATHIPMLDAQFDCIIANHMLYHVSDLQGALSEIKRVLRPGGRLFTATNGATHMCELVSLVAEADPDVEYMTGVVGNFSLENTPAQLGMFFESMEVRHYDDRLEVTDVEALCDYILSASTVFNLPESRKSALRSFIEKRFESGGGTFRISKDAGIIRAIK